jgi:hypothetical protein
VKIEVVRRIKEEMNVLHKINEGRPTGLVTYCVGNSLRNILLLEREKERWKGREDEVEDLNSHCMTIRKCKHTGN